MCRSVHVLVPLGERAHFECFKRNLENLNKKWCGRGQLFVSEFFVQSQHLVLKAADARPLKLTGAADLVLPINYSKAYDALAGLGTFTFQDVPLLQTQMQFQEYEKALSYEMHALAVRCAELSAQGDLFSIRQALCAYGRVLAGMQPEVRVAFTKLFRKTLYAILQHLFITEYASNLWDCCEMSKKVMTC